jgi:hypothetical protein
VTFVIFFLAGTTCLAEFAADFANKMTHSDEYLAVCRENDQTQGGAMFAPLHHNKAAGLTFEWAA